ncbi:hypothetical protein BDN70DRAFT_701455 [Pholiota conissans]|uniref:Uncharacterized protein n=1 Tax=Pholiota conissans TaxID=109636 RepID=A0A9P5Z1Q7_9AGAR|nr:hypothetical protein BDN70DRAFT_701455 [Pholiota conissans]
MGASISAPSLRVDDSIASTQVGLPCSPSRSCTSNLRPVPPRTLAHPHRRPAPTSHSRPSALHPFTPPPYLSPSMILCSPFLNGPPLCLPSSSSSPSLNDHSISAAAATAYPPPSPAALTSNSCSSTLRSRGRCHSCEWNGISTTPMGTVIRRRSVMA